MRGLVLQRYFLKSEPQGLDSPAKRANVRVAPAGRDSHNSFRTLWQFQLLSRGKKLTADEIS